MCSSKNSAKLTIRTWVDSTDSWVDSTNPQVDSFVPWVNLTSLWVYSELLSQKSSFLPKNQAFCIFLRPRLDQLESTRAFCSIQIFFILIFFATIHLSRLVPNLSQLKSMLVEPLACQIAFSSHSSLSQLGTTLSQLNCSHY